MLTRTVLTSALLLVSVFSSAYTASADKAAPIAQVYDVQGKAMVKSLFDGSTAEVKKGCLLGLDDSLTLDKNASVALYFKNGGRKEVQAKDIPGVYKVADLLPKAEAYAGQSVPLFGATRGMDIPHAASRAADFFYPQEAVILDSPPLIEFTLFNGAGEEVDFGGALVQLKKNNKVLDSKKFEGLDCGSAYFYQPAKLDAQTEYSIELKLELTRTPGNVVAISFPLYIAGVSDTVSASKYASFSDPVYRSCESAFIDYKGTKRTMTLIKQLARRGKTPAPVIVIEVFIP